MIRRLLLLAPVVAAAACLVLLPACGKKAPPVVPGGDPNVPAPGSGTPAGVASEYVAFAHLNGKDVVGGELFAEITKAFGTGGGPTMLSEAEKNAEGTLGVKPTDIASLSVFVTEVPERGEPKFVGILVANKAIDKAAVFKSLGITGSRPDRRGFHAGKGGPGLLHFADEKTAVMLHPELADQYLAGFAKDRTGWPLTADLTKAAEGHTLYAQVNVEKLRPTMKLGRDMDDFAPLLAAKTAVLTLDMKGKTLALTVRGSYPDAAAAGQAKETVTQGVGLAAFALMGEGVDSKMGATGPALKEAKRAIKDVKIEVAGSDLTVATSYTADFDFGPLVVESSKKVQESAGRMKAQGNLKQLGLALLNHNDANNYVPILGTGPNGAPLVVPGPGPKGGPAPKPAAKPLLSWRVALLPYLEQEALYKQFKQDEPWDSDHNKKLIDKMPKLFAPVGKPGKAGYTHLQMVVGPNALQPPVMRIPASFPDGTSNTIAVVEAAEAVVWTKPDDIMLPGKDVPKDLKKKFGGLFPGGFNALLWDGSVTFVSETVPEATLRAFLTPRGGEVVGPLR